MGARRPSRKAPPPPRALGRGPLRIDPLDRSDPAPRDRGLPLGGILAALAAVSLLGAPAAAQEIELTGHPSRWRISYDSVEVPGEPEMGLVGVHYDLLDEIPRWPGVYAGIGGFGAVEGDLGGFFVGGLSLGWQRELGAGFSFDAGGFAGGGGGGGAPQGGGLMLRPHAGLARDCGPFDLRLEIACVEFPDGDVGSTSLSLGLALDSELLTARTADGDGAAIEEGVLGFERLRSALAFETLWPSSGSRTRAGEEYEGAIQLAGFQLAAFRGEHLYVPLELWGAVGGGVSGYAAVMGGIGLAEEIVRDRLLLELELLAGAGGGGDVDTGGGLLLEASGGLRWRLDEEWSTHLSVGYLTAPDGDLDAAALELGVSWDPLLAVLPRSDERRRASRGQAPAEELELDSWHIGVHHKTYLPSSSSRAVGGGGMEPALQLFGLEIRRSLGEHLAITGGAFGAHDGGIGGYAEGLVGLEAGLAPFAALPELRLEAGWEVGAGGGGGMDVGSGLIHQVMGGLSWRTDRGLEIALEGGAMEPLGGGSFEAGVLQLSLGFEFARAIRR